jgi:hypothetical protein
MSFVKVGIQNLNNQVIEVFEGGKKNAPRCKDCGLPVEVGSSENGVVRCPDGHENKLQDLEPR